MLLHLGSLYSLALRLTGNGADAADLVQDSSLRAFERFDQLRQHGAAKAWLARILISTYLNRYAKPSVWADLTAAEEPLAEETPETALLTRARAEEVEAALAGLPEAFRIVVVLADVEEIPLREIAEDLGCPIGTVASRLARGRGMLRRRLAHLRTSREA